MPEDITSHSWFCVL